MVKFLCALMIFGLMAMGGYTAIVRKDPNFLFWNPKRKVETMYTHESLERFTRAGGISLMLTGLCGVAMSILYRTGKEEQALYLAIGALVFFTAYLFSRLTMLKKQ